MNRIFTFLGLLVAVFAVRAQEPEPKPNNNSFYLSTDLNVGNYIGLDAGLHYVFNEKFTLGVGFSRHLRVSRSRPSDFGTGLNFEELPIDYIYTYRIHGGPVFKLNESGRLRLTPM